MQRIIIIYSMPRTGCVTATYYTFIIFMVLTTAMHDSILHRTSKTIYYEQDNPRSTQKHEQSVDVCMQAFWLVLSMRNAPRNKHSWYDR